VLWAGIFLACAGVGAFIAYKFPPNLFPPGVQDPGGAPSESLSPPEPEVVRWRLTMASRTKHTYRVGGSCTSDWRLQGRIQLMDSGRVRGRGIARLQPGARCDFPSAQVQSRRVVVLIVGRADADELDLRFREGDREPVGSQDLGGFLKTLTTLRLSILERAGAETTERKRIEEPDDEIYASVTRLRLLRSL
jgi:hypothetical protein